MYNVLIVDDEQLMRTYLANNISAICPHFQITGIACDGIEAMELLDRQTFDLVITDIRMPEMDGLTLTKYIYETSPDTKIVIISGYNEFEYARSAIKYQVSEYLLKPLKDKNLLEVLTSVKKQLDMIPRKDIEKNSVSYSHLTDLSVLSSLLESILDGDSNLTYHLFHETEQRQITLMQSYGCILMLTIDELNLLLFQKNAYDITSYHLKLNQICNRYCQDHNLASYYDTDGNTHILLSSSMKTDFDRLAKLVYQDISRLASDINLPKIIATCGSIANDMMDLSYSNISAYDALALTLKNVKSPIFAEQTILNKAFILKLNTICSRIYTDYLSQSMDKLYADIKQYCLLFSQELSIAVLLRYGSYLIKYIRSRSNLKSHCIKASFEELTSHTDQLLTKGKLTDAEAYTVILNTMKALITIDKAPIISESDQIVEVAKQFILSHYNEQISLSLVAEHVGVNSCYLSDLIHKNLGEPYSKYIIRIRMEQAAQILKSNPNEKIYNVAEKTGFISSKHFISVFKKYYGMTPTNYLKE